MRSEKWDGGTCGSLNVQSGSEPFGLWGVTLGEQEKKIEGLEEKGRNLPWLANDSSPAGDGGGGALWTLQAS